MIIYKITNTVNGKFYIGKTTLTTEERFKKHFYNHKTGQTYLYKAMRKHGFDSFIIEELESNVNNLDEAEVKYISNLNPHYNMTSGGEGGDTSNSPNFIRAMQEMHSQRKPEDYATYGMKGKKQSDKFLNTIKKSNSYPVSCEGTIYESIVIAQEAYKGISIRKRIDNPKYPDFYRLRPKRHYPLKA